LALSDYILQARQRADHVNSGFVTDAEVTNWLNEEGAELYDLMVQRYEQWFTQVNAVTISTGSTYTLPSNTQKLVSIDKVDGNNRWPLREIPYMERARYNSDYLTYFSNVGPVPVYYILGATVQLLPRTVAAATYEVASVTGYTDLVNPTDDLPAFMKLSRWHAYMIVGAAIKILQKEESDVSVLLQEKLALKARIENAASNRDTSGGERIADVMGGMWDFYLPLPIMR
jgi:hypothetical protein